LLTKSFRAQSDDQRKADLEEAIREIRILRNVINCVVTSKMITNAEAEKKLATARKRFSDFYYTYNGANAPNGRYEKKYGRRTDYDPDVHQSARLAGGLFISEDERNRGQVSLSTQRKTQLKSACADLEIYLSHLNVLKGSKRKS